MQYSSRVHDLIHSEEQRILEVIHKTYKKEDKAFLRGNNELTFDIPFKASNNFHKNQSFQPSLKMHKSELLENINQLTF